ncbi:YkvA family protein [Solicola sp. PLA-1-18]|uniref:YkvA family protein n=1 Tax=Solicola sp. PLA-1-18 TaxID=3380532 RepID=UPI003B78BB9D
MSGWAVTGAIVAGLVAVGAAVLVALLLALRRVPGHRTGLREAVGLLPSCVVLARRLHGDASLPASVRWQLRGLLLYLASPIDLVPDVVPVLGWADDVLVALLVLRRVLRSAGPDAVARHWPGTPEGLDALRRLTGG